MFVSLYMWRLRRSSPLCIHRQTYNCLSMYTLIPDKLWLLKKLQKRLASKPLLRSENIHIKGFHKYAVYAKTVLKQEILWLFPKCPYNLVKWALMDFLGYHYFSLQGKCGEGRAVPGPARLSTGLKVRAEGPDLTMLPLH